MLQDVDGFIAYFDLLGFSNASMYDENFPEKIDKYHKILSEATNLDSQSLEYIAFSDSVIIHSNSNSEEQLLSLLLALSEISYSLLTKLNMVMCGCVSVGKFKKSRQNNNFMIVGTPLLDAIDYEKTKLDRCYDFTKSYQGLS